MCPARVRDPPRLGRRPEGAVARQRLDDHFTDVAPGEAALVIVFHHVLADGIGGLAVLASLVDGAPESRDLLFPRPRPSSRQLAVDAARGRIRSLVRLPAALRRIGGAVAAGGPLRRLGAVLRAAPGQRRRPRQPERGHPLAIPGVGDPAARLDAVAETTRAAKRAAPGASTAVLGPLFQLLARAGLYQRFIERQRLIHTLVTKLRGPEARLAMFGCPITSIIPLSVATGNVTMSFAVLSYAGTLAVTIIAGPDVVHDLPALRQALADELGALAVST